MDSKSCNQKLLFLPSLVSKQIMGSTYLPVNDCSQPSDRSLLWTLQSGVEVKRNASLRERVWLQKFGTFAHLSGRMKLLQQVRNKDPRTRHFFILSKREWELWSAEGPTLIICSYNTNQAGNMMHLCILSLSKTQGKLKGTELQNQEFV